MAEYFKANTNYKLIKLDPVEGQSFDQEQVKTLKMAIITEDY